MHLALPHRVSVTLVLVTGKYLLNVAEPMPLHVLTLNHGSRPASTVENNRSAALVRRLVASHDVAGSGSRAVQHQV